MSLQETVTLVHLRLIIDKIKHMTRNKMEYAPTYLRIFFMTDVPFQKG